MLWGLGRTLALEHPEFWGRVIDIDESVPDGMAASYVVDEAQADDHEDQVVYRAGVRRVPRLQKGLPPSATSTAPAELSADSSYLVIGATGNIGPHLIQQLADSGAGTVVAVSRNPGSKLDDLAARLAPSGTTLVTAAADAADETALSAVFDRFGNDLPPLAGIYVAAFGGGPITAAGHDGRRRHRNVPAQAGRGLGAAPAFVAAQGRSVRAVLVDLRSDRVSLAGALHRDHHVPGHLRAGSPGRRSSGHRDQLGTVEVVVRRAIRRGASGHPVLWSGADGRRRRHQGAAAAHRPGRRIAADRRRRRLAAARRRVPHQGGAAHRGRPAVRPTTAGDDSSAARSTEFRDALREADPTRRRGILVDHVTAQVVGAMGLASAQLLDPTAGFFQSGMDSLMSVTLQRALSDSLGETLPASVVFDYPTVEALSDYLATLLPEVAEATEDESADDYDDFSDDELLKAAVRKAGLSAMTAPPDRRAIITEALRKIDDLTARLEIAEKADLEPIAVVGMACRLPGGVNTPDDYWQLLHDGRQRR